MTSYRSRAIILTGAKLAPGEYQVRESAITVLDKPVPGLGDQHCILNIDLKSESSMSIRDAFIRSYDIIDEFLDRIALVAYCPAVLVKFISTSPSRVSVGEEFDMATEELLIRNTPINVSPTDFTIFDAHKTDSAPIQACRLIRKALSFASIEERFLYLYQVFERISEDETTEKIREECPNCGDVKEKGKATSRYMKKLLNDFGIEHGKSRDLSELRGKLAHGAGLRNQAFLKELAEAIGKIEAASVSVAVNRCNATLQNTQGVVIGRPMTLRRCVKKSDGSFKILSTHWEAAITIAKVTRCASTGQNTQIDFGQPMNEPIIDIAWPD